MKKIEVIHKKLLLCAVALFFLPQSAKAFCEPHDIHTYIETVPGNVQYITTKSKDEFVEDIKNRYGINENRHNLRGMTVAILSQRIHPQEKSEQFQNQICARLESLHFKIGHNNGIKVYIDKKYKPGSCEYEIIRKHEDYHVAVHQQAFTFFKPDIKKKIHEIVGKLKPKIVYSKEEVSNFLNSQVQQVSNELNSFIEDINKIIRQKNAIIDTPESYEKTQALCKNW